MICIYIYILYIYYIYIIYIYIIYIYIYNGMLLSPKKEGNFAICNNMDGLGGCYAKWNKSDKDKYYMISLICGI